MRLDPININWGNMLNGIEIPKMILVKQNHDLPTCANIAETVKSELKKVIGHMDLKGKRIGVPIGSRGIHHIDVILKATVDYLKSVGAEPFIFPAMGTHGNATAQGQLKIAAAAGVTEKSMGCKILATMDTVVIGHLDNGTPVYVDKFAAEADGLIPIHKIKPHADFKADNESGLTKMMAIGMGNFDSANAIHRYGFAYFKDLLPKAAKEVINKLPVLMAVGLVENAHAEIMRIEGIKPSEIVSKESELLGIAKSNIAKIMLRDIDVVIIEEIGKNISGAGMDPNVIGRPGSGLTEGFENFGFTRVVALDLTDQSEHNGTGIGLADFTTRDVIEKIDMGLMYTSTLPTLIVNPSRLPIILENDRLAILTAIKSSAPKDLKNARIVRIKNTKELDYIQVSEALRDDVIGNDRLTIVEENLSISFDENDRLIRDVFV